MSKTYQIKAIDAAGKPLLETLQSASGKGPLTLQALPGVRYSLIDVQQGSAPDNIRVQRAGKHLKVLFDGSSQPDLVLENYFESVADAPTPTLTGVTDSGAIYEYVPESGRLQDSLQRLSDGSLPQGMALGGTELAPTTGAAVGLLAPVASGGLGLGAAGAGALGAAALGGGGGGGGAAAKPAVTALHLAAESDSGPTGDSITKLQTPKIVGKATPMSEVKLVLNGNIPYSTTADANGDFSIDLASSNTPLNAGRYTLQATALKAGVTSDSYTGTGFTIDTSAGVNFDANGNPVSDLNSDTTLTGLSLLADSGQANDLMTSVSTQKFMGTLASYASNGDKVLVKLTKLGNSSFQEISDYLTLNAQNQWTWDQSALTLAPGKYQLTATLVDGAGNPIENRSGIITRTDTITVSPGNGKIVDPTDGTIQDDPNSINAASAPITRLGNDTGSSASDFITNDNTLRFDGTLEHFTRNGDMVKVELKSGTGAVLYTDYISPTSNTWSWDLSSQKLADGPYELTTSIVDAGGTQVTGTTAQHQTLAIDTSASKNQSLTAQSDDANSTLTLVLTNMTDSADGVHTSTASDKITGSTSPVFSGTFGTGKSWSDDGDVFKLQVQNLQTGAVIDVSPTLSNGNATWTSANWTTPLSADGLYLAKASILDAAGNVLSMVQQAFAVDHTAPSLQFTEAVKDITIEGIAFSNGMTVSKLALSSNEAMHYVIKTGTTVLAEGDYSGMAGTTGHQLNGSFDAGAFTVTYTDAAGNTSSYTNTSKLVFSDIALATSAPHDYTSTATPLESLGSISTLRLNTADTTLDLTSVIGDGQLHNHIDMSASGTQHLSLNLNDVLSLGVVNSFQWSDMPRSDLLQLRVDGESSDTLVFKDREAWSVATSTVHVGNNDYFLYTSHDSHGALVEVLVQQGILVSS